MTNQDCPFEQDIQKRMTTKKSRSAFMVSPFGYPYDDVFVTILKPAAKEAKIALDRADQAFQLGFVMCRKICMLIQEDDYLIADVTEDNPNVFYELGLAWGFGKKVVLIRDSEIPAKRGFLELLQRYDEKVITYRHLFDLRDAPKEEKGLRFKEFLESKHVIDTNAEFDIDKVRDPAAYINSKGIYFCYREKLSDAKFYEHQMRVVANNLNCDEPEQWTVKISPLNARLLEGRFSDAFKSSKVCLIDVTHYDEKPDPIIYFMLGLAHALGRETIPITNSAKNRGGPPFDVRGLLQIYFKDLKTFTDELAGILGVIDDTYREERTDYPLRFIWDRILKPHARLNVFTCARGNPAGENRGGGRTNVDKWDYQSVTDLAFFLAHKYKQAEMNVAPPMEKETIKLMSVDGKKEQATKIHEDIQKTDNSVIIIGSPDVSDYAEIVLAQAYGIEPYHSRPCYRTDQQEMHKCWTCHEASECISKRGYMFYKETVAPGATGQAREISAFYRRPPEGEKDCVVWYGEQYPKPSQATQDAVELTYGVLTIFKSRGKDGEKDKWIILLSGFTGVATYGLAHLLTGLPVSSQIDDEKDGKSKDGKTLQQLLKERTIDLEQHGAQVLLEIRYTSKSNAQDRDSREPTGTTIIDVRRLRYHG